MGNALVQLIINIVSGGVGGNVAGAILKKYSLGPLANTIVGIIGGGLGGQLLSTIGGQPGGIAGEIAGSAVGGGALMAIIGLIKNAASAVHGTTR